MSDSVASSALSKSSVLSKSWPDARKPTAEAAAASGAAADAEQEVDDIAQHVDIEEELATVSLEQQIMLMPDKFKDIATGVQIPNARCLEIAKTLDK